MLPLLQLAADEKEHKFRDAVEIIATQFNLTEVERSELLPSGTQAIFDNRMGWARSYLKQACLLESPKRGSFKITVRGQSVLKEQPLKINNAFLEQFQEFRDFKQKKKIKLDQVNVNSLAENEDQQTPEDQLASAYQSLRATLKSDLIDQIKQLSPAFFERLVIDLLVKMGYGGSRSDAGRALGKTGDGGIDGIIKEDRLGLDVIYIQAKRWEGSVGRPEIQKFAGALQGQRAKKGVFITTSWFTKEAEEYASFIDSRIILIDGDYLSSLMVDNNVGVSTAGIYEVKRIDADYFDGE